MSYNYILEWGPIKPPRGLKAIRFSGSEVVMAMIASIFPICLRFPSKVSHTAIRCVAASSFGSFLALKTSWRPRSHMDSYGLREL